MKYFTDKSKGAVYLQLYEQLKADIIGGVYLQGERLPSKRTLAAETGLSTVTVEHAYSLLCDEGYAVSKEKSGYFVAFSASAGFALAPHVPAARRVSSPDGDEATAFPFSTLARTMRRVLSEYGEATLDRPPNEGCAELREALRRYLALNRGIDADLEQIIIGSGAEYVYSLIIAMFGRDMTVAIETPSYEKIDKVYAAAEIKRDLLPLTEDGISSEALAASDAKVLHTTPYRSYPSGVTASASKRHEYVRWASRGDRYIIEDDFESEFSVSSKPTETLFNLSKKENVIYLNTFSKTISPSMRISYMVLPKSLVPVFRKKLGFYSCTVPTFEQLVIAEIINSGDLERHINRVRRELRKRAAGQKNENRGKGK